jgi:hypothetical protein
VTGDRDSTGKGGVLELPMAASNRSQLPAAIVQEPDYFSNRHRAIPGRSPRHDEGRRRRRRRQCGSVTNQRTRQLWLNLQSHYDLEVERDLLGDRLRREVIVLRRTA